MTPGVIWPILIIVAGVGFLLANLGYLPPVNVGGVLRLLWPLILIIVGIDLVLARRRRAAAVALQLTVVAIGLALLLLSRPEVLGVSPSAQPSRGDRGSDVGLASAVTVARAGAQSASVRFGVAAGRFELSGGASALVEARSGSPDLRERVTRTADRADVRLDQQFAGFFGARTMAVKVSSDVPMTIRLESGAGEFSLDLREVKATDVRIETGASSLTLILPKPTGDVPVRIQAGASSIVIEVPPGVEAKVSTSGGLVSASGRTETPGYAAATDRVTVSVQAGASSIAVR